MEILVLVLALIALDILANLVGPDTRDIETALRHEAVPVRSSAWAVARPRDPWDR